MNLKFLSDVYIAKKFLYAQEYELVPAIEMTTQSVDLGKFPILKSFVKSLSRLSFVYSLS